jgi:HEAT repeat protein
MPEDLQRLLDSLMDEDQPVPTLDLAQLSDLDSAQAQTLDKHWQHAPASNRQAVMRHLGQLAQDHIELDFEIVNRIALDDPDPAVRRQAVANLWECEDPDLARQLVTLMKEDSDEAVRARAAEALGRFVYLGEVDKLEANLLKSVEDQLLALVQADSPGEPGLRALESLGYSSRPEVSGLIEAAYASSGEDIKRASVMAMGRSAHEQWVQAVSEELHNPSPLIREEAARAAGELEARSAVASLIELLDDAKLPVRRAAIWSLGLIGGKRAERALVGLQANEAVEEDAGLIEDALDYLNFLGSTPDFLLMDLDGPDDEDDEEDLPRILDTDE